MPFERPRVRAEGPGGEEVKQGARIACLDCRSAKIRCSAPTDGKVPCKRCARHGRECVFEKHRRGRKPGRTNNLKSLAGSEMDSADFSMEFGSDTSMRSGDHHQHHRADPYYGPSAVYGGGMHKSPSVHASNPPSMHHYAHAAHPPFHPHQSPGGGGSTWAAARLVEDPRIASPRQGQQVKAAHEQHHHRHASSSSSTIKSSYMRPPPPNSPPLGRNEQPLRSYKETHDGGVFAANRHSGSPYIESRSIDLHLGGQKTNEHALSYHGSRLGGDSNTYSPPSSGLQSSSLGSGTTPGRSWLDFPTPGTRSLLSPSHMISTSISTFPSSNGSMSNAWPGSAITSPHKRKGPTDYFAGALPLTKDEPQKKQRNSHRESAERGVASVADSSTPRSPASHRIFVEDEEEIDHMDEDEVGAMQEGDVLSTPLRLLAHASDAALALRQAKGDAGEGSRKSTSVGAATMGLVSPPVPSLPAPRRWFDSGRLPSMMLDRTGGEGSNLRAFSSGPRGLLPKLANVAQRRDGPNRASPLYTRGASEFSSTFPPPILASLGRSRSYTAVNAAPSRPSRPPEQHVHDAPSIVAPVTQVERRAEVLGIHTDVNGRQVEDKTGEFSMTATTLDPDAWEYRNGRVRSRRKSGSAGGAGTQTGTGATSSFEEDVVSSSSGVKAGLEKDVESNTASDVLVAATKQRAFRKRLDSLDSGSNSQRRWEVVRRRPVKRDEDLNHEDAVSIGSSEESEKLGASHQDFFSLSIFHSKMDIDLDLDPIESGVIELHELEKLFDVFFARINPLLTMFDPFLHSVTYVRHRSALLTTVIAALAARLSDSGRSAELALALENHWRNRLLPEALLGGYKSVELAQAFMVLALYHKPTNRLSEDRSWQYLGFAVRIATEIGVNRVTQPNDEVKNNEQVRRRMRNRARLWICLWLTDRSMGLQTGRPFTISEDDMIANSDLWHREAFALPEDARLVSLIKLLRTMTSYCQAFGQIIKQHSAESLLDLPKAQESVKMLNLCRLQATTELDRWKDIWCVEALDESRDGIQSVAISTFLDKWRPRAKIDMLYARLHLNSIVLEGLEGHQRLIMGVVSLEDSTATTLAARLEETRTMIEKVASDVWDTTLKMIDILLNEVSEEDLAAGPNALSVNVIYGALAALRLSSKSWAERSAIVIRCKSLADVFIKAGQTPEHRNGAAAPFGTYLKGIIQVWEAEKVGVVESESGGEQEEKAEQPSVAETASETPKRPALNSTHTSGQLHSVGDDVWGASRNVARKSEINATVSNAADALSMDRMWDYLTTYPDSASTFPMSLWQPHLAAAAAATLPENQNVNSAFVTSETDVLAAAAAAAGTGGQMNQGILDSSQTLVDAGGVAFSIPIV